jgi:hypothetical protein
VDPVTLLATALASGALKGASETATTAVKDAYIALKNLVAKRLGGEPSGEMVLSEHQNKPDVWHAPLVEVLTKSGAAEDLAVVEAAQQLLGLLDQEGTRVGKYTLDLRGSQGVQIGDHNQQANTFAVPPTMPT